jgi:hypothetical protein
VPAIGKSEFYLDHKALSHIGEVHAAGMPLSNPAPSNPAKPAGEASALPGNPTRRSRAALISLQGSKATKPHASIMEPENGKALSIANLAS